MPTTLDLEQERSGHPPPPHYSRIRRESEIEAPRSRGPLWTAIAVLAAGVAGLAWYATSHMGTQDGLIGELKGWPAAVSAVRQQLTAAENRLAQVPRDLDALHGRV